MALCVPWILSSPGSGSASGKPLRLGQARPLLSPRCQAVRRPPGVCWAVRSSAHQLSGQQLIFEPSSWSFTFSQRAVSLRFQHGRSWCLSRSCAKPRGLSPKLICRFQLDPPSQSSFCSTDQRTVDFARFWFSVFSLGLC